MAQFHVGGPQGLQSQHARAHGEWRHPQDHSRDWQQPQDSYREWQHQQELSPLTSNEQEVKEVQGRPIDFDRGNLTRILLYVGVGLAFLGGVAFVVAGVYVSQHEAGPHVSVTVQNGDESGTPWTLGIGAAKAIMLPKNAREGISLSLSFLVTILNDALGMVHSTTLRWMLARQHRLEFHANLRLFRLGGRWWQPSGLVVNGLFAIAVIISYTCTSLVVLTADEVPIEGPSMAFISPIPLFFLGGSLLLQVALALYAIFTVPVTTWSGNCIDVAAAMEQEGLVYPVPGRCLRPTASRLDRSAGPRPVQSRQPSAWRSHIVIRRVVRFSWLLVAAVACWSGIEWYFRDPDTGNSWTLFPNPRSPNESAYMSFADQAVTNTFMLVAVGETAAIQALITMGLYTCDLVAAVSRDESTWRRAATHAGLDLARNPVVSYLASWQNVSMFAFKSVAHWFFGMGVHTVASDGIRMSVVQVRAGTSTRRLKD